MRILVTCRTCGEPLLTALSSVGEVVTSPHRATRALTEDELVEAVRDIEVIVAGTDPFSERVIKAGASSGLKMIARFGIGLDNVDLKAATESRVVVTYAPRASSVSVAEFTVGLTIALLRRIPESDSAVKTGAWPMGSMRGNEVSGKTVGVIGLGAIGKRVADVLSYMGAHIIAYDPYVKNDPRLVTLEMLLRSSDVVTIHSALSVGSRHLVCAKVLSILKKSAVLINTLREAIIHEGALVAALEGGRLAGAALDVLEVEPPGAQNLLAKFPNVIITPHIAGNTVEATERTGRTLVDDIKRVLTGVAPLYPANPDVLTALGLKQAS
jgi:phosphoglycerate dehydrogenase-like enzyme